MVEFDFDDVETADFQSVPPGTYVCRVEEVRSGTARDGSERWSIKWLVDSGSFAGRFAAWDNLTFNERAGRRVKLVLSRLGVASSGKIRIAPEQLIGKKAVVTLVTGEWRNEATGERILRNQVPWDGYREYPDGEGGNGAGEEPPKAAASRSREGTAREDASRQGREQEGVPF